MKLQIYNYYIAKLNKNLDDSDMFFYSVVSFLLAIIAYLIFGRLLDISYLVSVSLAITGGVWSYLSIEQNKIKELRGEYINQLKEAEKASLDFIDQGANLYSCISKYRRKNEGDVNESFMYLLDEQSRFTRKRNLYIYKRTVVRTNSFNTKDFKNLDRYNKEMVGKLYSHVRKIRNGDLSCKNTDDMELNKINNHILIEMALIFQNVSVSFEDFSEDYRNKKNICFSIICISVFTVALKSFFSIWS